MQEIDPFFSGVLFGEPYGGGADGDIGGLAVPGDGVLVCRGWVKAWFGGDRAGEVFDQFLVAVDLVSAADDMRDPFCKKAAERVFIETDGLSGAGKHGQQTGSGKALDVYQGIVSGAADPPEQAPEIPELVSSFIPDQGLVDEGMSGEQGFIAFAEHEIDLCVGEGGVQFLDDGGREHYVTYKRRLYDQEFLHDANLRENVESGSDGGRGSVAVPSHDGGGSGRGCFVLTIANGIADALPDRFIDLRVAGGGGLGGDIGGGRDDGFPESFYQVFTECLPDETDGDGIVGGGEVIGETDGAFVDHGGGFFCRRDKIENTGIGLTGIFQDIAGVGDQDDQGFRFGASFQCVDLFHGVGVGGVAADAPNGIGGIADQASGPQYRETTFYVLFEIRVHFYKSTSKNNLGGVNYICTKKRWN